MQYHSIMPNTATIGKSALLTLLGVGIALVLILLPQSALAYTTTAQSVTKLSDDAYLFQITYRLNFLNRDVRVPIMPTRLSTMSDFSTSSPQLQFSLRDANGGLLTTGNTTAVVLSQVSIDGGQYYLPERTPGFFTLIALVTRAPGTGGTLSPAGTAKLQIDWLPFTLIDDGEEQLARVPEADLLPFKTPSIVW
jgi:hypothetical protein